MTALPIHKTTTILFAVSQQQCHAEPMVSGAIHVIAARAFNHLVGAGVDGSTRNHGGGRAAATIRNLSERPPGIKLWRGVVVVDSPAERLLVRGVAMLRGEDGLEHVPPAAERADAEPLDQLLDLRQLAERPGITSNLSALEVKLWRGSCLVHLRLGLQLAVDLQPQAVSQRNPRSISCGGDRVRGFIRSRGSRTARLHDRAR